MIRIATTSIILIVAAVSGVLAENGAQEAISEAEDRFYEAKSKIESDFRRDLSALLAKGDRIEVYLLDFEVEDTPSNFLFWETRLGKDEFPIIPYGGKSKILKSSVISDDQRAAFLPKLQEVVGVQGEIGGGGMCHLPIHGVRVFSGEEIIFQSSFCWKCHNFAISYPDAPAWIGIRGNDLFNEFNRILPIPQSEIDRFEAEFSGTRKKKTAHPEAAQ